MVSDGELSRDQLERELEILRARVAELEGAPGGGGRAGDEAWRLLGQVFDLLPCWVAAKDREGRYILINRAYAEAMRSTPGELLGKDDGAVVQCREEFDQFRAQDLQVLRTREPLWIPEECVRDAHGEIHYMQTLKLPFAISETREPAVLILAMDITERKRAELALRKANEDVARAIPAGLFTYRYAPPESLELVAGNPEAQRLTGLDLEASIGREFDEIWPQARERGLTERLLEVMRRGEPCEIEDFVYEDAELLGIYRIRAFPMPGERLGVAFEDVTERKRLAEQLQQSQKMEAVGQLAGGVAHDFNNLLTAILGNAELARNAARDIGSGSDVELVIQALQEIRKAGERGAGLTRQLLTFSRKQIPEPRILAIGELLAGMENMLRRLIGEHIEISIRCARDLPRFRIDRSQIEQAIMNLALNARDAMPDGGELRIEGDAVTYSESRAERPHDAPAGAYLRIAFTDTGTGMSAEVRAHIFEPFYTTKPVDKGTGLGLATVYGIVRQAGGHVGVRSAPGKGTRFELLFPAMDAAADANPSVRESPVAGGEETILLTEDDETVRRLALSCLRGGGYRVLEAQDGVHALEVADTHEGPIHLLITDLIMPRMNGRELAAELKKSRPQMRVLFMSGYASDVIDAEGVLADKLRFLPKPFHFREMLARVREVLDMS